MPPAHRRTALYIGASCLLAIVLAEIAAILFLNEGKFTYTLDDAYIHMALAENLRHAHYGVNAGEFSAPSSSILWPFIVAISASFECFPLLLNMAAALATVFVFYRILDRAFAIGSERDRTALFSVLLILLVCVTNSIGLVFNGMEHSLQVLLVTLIAYGLIVEVETNDAPNWLVFAIVAAPLVRYEDMAISCPAIAYLLARRHYRPAVASAVVLALTIGGFSLFLHHLGLGFFPTSVLEKSSVVESGGQWDAVLGNLRRGLVNPRGQLLIGTAAGLLVYCAMRKSGKERLLAAATTAAIVLHLIAGRYGWYDRYEIYIWTFSLLVCCYLFAASTKIASTGVMRKADFIKLALACCLVCYFGRGFFQDLLTLPFASNNIYEQQYQMHRFAVDYYGKPVAVNDLGFVSYRNRNYVLDLYGLASLDALRSRKSGADTQWMDTLAKAKQVELAMVYENWFSSIPSNWIKIGSLRLGKERITAANSDVAFYALNQSAYEDVALELHEFRKTLPEDVQFVFSQKEDSPRGASGSGR